MTACNGRWPFLCFASAVLITASASTSAPVDSRVAAPTARPTGLTARTIAAGFGHTCVVTPEGAVKCWGWNGFGQVGTGTAGESGGPEFVRHPMDVAGLSGGAVTASAGGAHSCAITTTDSLRCWGSNTYGQLGDGTSGSDGTGPRQRPEPVPVVGLGSGVATVTLGYLHTCALTTVGAALCWGFDYTAEGDPAVVVPEPVPGLSTGVMAIVAGAEHTCAALANRVVCWGDDSFLQLGGNAVGPSRVPVDVPGLGIGVTAIAAGAAHTCALLADATVKCWGDNRYGQLGDGTFVIRPVPVAVIGLGGPATAITAGGGHTCALLAGGHAKCWGHNWAGQLGNGRVNVYEDTTYPVPEDVVGLDGPVATLAASTIGGHDAFEWKRGEFFAMEEQSPYHGHTCAILQDGAVRCWGANYDGQLGDGGTVSRGVPGPIFVPTDTVALPLTWR